MKLIIIRHGDPDYTIDSLTEKGRREAELLSERISRLNIKDFYVSPLGRAKDTASPTLNKMGRTAEVCDWLREFDAKVLDKYTGERRIAWDMLPEYWTAVEEYYDKQKWHTVPLMAEGKVYDEAVKVYNGLDGILEKHGYKRDGEIYKAVKPNNDTVVMFCHFGVQCVMLGHLTGISPVILWHNFCALPTSVTTVITEERRKGTAIFRVNGFGDISHLYAGGEEPAFAARFCEAFDNADERHD